MKMWYKHSCQSTVSGRENARGHIQSKDKHAHKIKHQSGHHHNPSLSLLVREVYEGLPQGRPKTWLPAGTGPGILTASIYTSPLRFSFLTPVIVWPHASSHLTKDLCDKLI